MNSVHEMHIVFENLSNIDGYVLQRAWGLNIGEDSIKDLEGCGRASEDACASDEVVWAVEWVVTASAGVMSDSENIERTS